MTEDKTAVVIVVASYRSVFRNPVRFRALSPILQWLFGKTESYFSLSGEIKDTDDVLSIKDQWPLWLLFF